LYELSEDHLAEFHDEFFLVAKLLVYAFDQTQSKPEALFRLLFGTMVQLNLLTLFLDFPE
jgi:hypothetical protein